jgi:hypothetical protein
VTCDMVEIAYAHLQLAAYRSSSPVVALWLGRPAATLAAASDAEFFTGEYAAHTWGTSRVARYVWFQRI